MTEQWIEEILFRGRPPSGPSSEEPGSFHVVIGLQADDPLSPGEKTRKLLGPMSLSTAEELGYTFEDILHGINTDVIKRVSELEAQVKAKEEV